MTVGRAKNSDALLFLLFASVTSFLVALLIHDAFLEHGRIGILRFWILNLTIVGLLFSQSQFSNLKATKSLELILVIELALFAFSDAALFQWRGDGNVPGYDSQLDMGATLVTYEGKWPDALGAGAIPQLESVYLYPILHILTLVLRDILGSSLTFSALLIPPVLVFCTMIIAYLLTRTIFRDPRVSVASALAFMFSMTFFTGGFVRQPLGVFFLLISLWLSVALVFRESGRSHIFVLAIICPTIALTHHFSAFAGFALLCSIAVVRFILRERNRIGIGIVSKIKPDFYSGLILIVAWLLLSITLDIGPLSVILQSWNSVENTGIAKIAHVTIATEVYLSLLGNAILVLLACAAVILLYIRSRESRLRALCIAALWWSAFLVGGIFLLNRIGLGPIGLARALLYSWILLLPLTFAAIYRILDRKRRNAVVAASLLFLVSFASLGMLSIPEYYYDNDSKPYYNAGDFSIYLSQEDFAVLSIPVLQGRIIGDQGIKELLAGYWRVDVDVDLNVYRGNTTSLLDANWFIVRSENFLVVYDRSEIVSENITKLSLDYFALLKNGPMCNVVYDNSEVWVFQVNKGSS